MQWCELATSLDLESSSSLPACNICSTLRCPAFLKSIMHMHAATCEARADLELYEMSDVAETCRAVLEAVSLLPSVRSLLLQDFHESLQLGSVFWLTDR